MKCYNCGRNVPDDSSFCGYCRADLRYIPVAKKRNDTLIIAICSVVLVLLVSGVGSYIFINNRTNQSSRDYDNSSGSVSDTLSEYSFYDESSEEESTYDEESSDEEISSPEENIAVSESSQTAAESESTSSKSESSKSTSSKNTSSKPASSKSTSSKSTSSKSASSKSTSSKNTSSKSASSKNKSSVSTSSKDTDSQNASSTVTSQWYEPENTSSSAANSNENYSSSEEVSSAASGVPSDWAQAYIDYLETSYQGLPYSEYALVYIDNDDIPELFINTNIGAGGELFCTYSNGNIETVGGHYSAPYYIERGGLVAIRGGKQGGYYDNVYKLENGKFNTVGLGFYTASNSFMNDENATVTSIQWNQKDVTKNEYMESLNSAFDFGNAVLMFDKPSYSYDEMLSMLGDM